MNLYSAPKVISEYYPLAAELRSNIFFSFSSFMRYTHLKTKRSKKLGLYAAARVN